MSNGFLRREGRKNRKTVCVCVCLSLSLSVSLATNTTTKNQTKQKHENPTKTLKKNFVRKLESRPIPWIASESIPKPLRMHQICEKNRSSKTATLHSVCVCLSLYCFFPPTPLHSRSRRGTLASNPWLLSDFTRVTVRWPWPTNTGGCGQTVSLSLCRLLSD